MTGKNKTMESSLPRIPTFLTRQCDVKYVNTKETKKET